jgi:hypothetical protein
MFKKFLASLATVALGIGLATAAVGPAAASPYTNNPANWQVGAETCVKYDFGDPNPSSQSYADLTNLFALSGKTVTKVIIKSGSTGNGGVVFENTAYYSDPAYIISNPSIDSETSWVGPVSLTGTTFTHASGKGISHVIVCYITAALVDVSGAATPIDQSCDTTTGSLVSGSITPDTTKTGVTYQLWDSTKTTLLIDNFAANSGALANGPYYVKVLPASGAYTVSDANTWIPITVGAYGPDCIKITDVSGAATPIDQSCDTTTGSLVSGSITPDTTKTGVTYQLWDSTKTTLLIDNFAANSGALANGPYYVKVLPASGAYTVSDANTWIPITVGAYGPDCNEEVKVIGDPEVKQFCELDIRTFEPTGNWISYLTISTSSSNPAGSVQYRVYFDDNGTWVDKGIWPEGTYNAGPDAGNPYEIPYGTKLKVVAEATAGYQISTPNEWEYTFTQPGRCSLDTLPGVTPTITFNQTCAAGPTYTLGVEGGPAGSILFSVNNGPFSAALGTFPATASTKFTFVADATDGYGLEGIETETYEVSHTYGPASVCGELTTLALTGQDPSPFLAMAGFLGMLGVGLVRAGNRSLRRTAN